MLEPTERNTLIRKIPSINHPTHVKLPPGADYRRYIEPPLIEAVQTLVERGVRTVACSANQLDVGEMGYLTIDYQSLSEPNRRVADHLVRKGEGRYSNRL